MNTEQKLSNDYELHVQNLNPNLRNLINMGNHLILDFHGIKETVDLDNYESLDASLREVMGYTHVAIEGSCYKKFEPQGLSIVYLLSESHFSIHTWPESRACAVDFYHCGDKSVKNLKIAEEKLCELFGWNSCTSTMIMKRGQVSSYLTNDFFDKTEVLRNVTLVHREKSRFQDIRVYDTLALGRILTLDGAFQFSSTSVGNNIYSMDMAKYALNKDKVYENVIIIGGGDLLIAHQILTSYEKVKKVTVVELDEKVIEVTKKFFEFGEKLVQNFSDKLEVVVDHGAWFMDKLLKEGKEGTIGAVIIDCTDFLLDSDSLSVELFDHDFYATVCRLLENGAGFTQQITKSYYQGVVSERAVKGGFNKVEIYKSISPDYGGNTSIACAFKC